MQGFWAHLHPSDTVATRNGPHAEAGPVFGHHNSSRGAAFVAMMQTTDLRERNNLACRREVVCGEAADNPCLARDALWL